MKKTPKKLVLAKETVMNLDEADNLREVMGGIVSASTCYSIVGGRCTSEVC